MVITEGRERSRTFPSATAAELSSQTGPLIGELCKKCLSVALAGRGLDPGVYSASNKNECQKNKNNNVSGE
jgi:hypothetical protein